MSGHGGANLRSVVVKTGPYPGFPTDLQPQIMAFLTTCNGLSSVEESVFDKRMSHGMWKIMSVLVCILYMYSCRLLISLFGKPIILPNSTNCIGIFLYMFPAFYQ